MSQTQTKPSIRSKQVYSIDDDTCDFKTKVPVFCQVLTNTASPATFCINGAWGSGKTTFIKFCRDKLEKRDKPLEKLDSKGDISLYFNAWENDNITTNVFSAFLAEMELQINGLTQRTDWKKHISIVKNIVNISAGVASKKLVGSKAIGDAVNNAIDYFIKFKQDIASFKENLPDILFELGADTIYIFVDDVDRCRPTHAIELLETIKHLFDIEGLIFVIAMDEEQLCHSIKALYGNEFDAKTYLKKFIDYKYSLPQPVDYKKFIESTLKNRNLEIDNEIEAISDLMNQLCLAHIKFNKENEAKWHTTFSLREIEKIINKFCLCLSFFDEIKSTLYQQHDIHFNKYHLLITQIYYEFNNSIFHINWNALPSVNIISIFLNKDNYNDNFFIDSISNRFDIKSQAKKDLLFDKRDNWNILKSSLSIYFNIMENLMEILNLYNQDDELYIKYINLLHLIKNNNEFRNEFEKYYLDIQQVISLTKDFEKIE